MDYRFLMIRNAIPMPITERPQTATAAGHVAPPITKIATAAQQTQITSRLMLSLARLPSGSVIGVAIPVKSSGDSLSIPQSYPGGPGEGERKCSVSLIPTGRLESGRQT
jgi:hypothetical protein